MPEYDKKIVSFFELIAVLFFVILVTIFYLYFDTKSILTIGIYPWDSDQYRLLAEGLHSDEAFSSKATSPFSYRVLFPWIYGLIHDTAGLPYVYSSLILNLISSWAVLLLAYIFWRMEDCGKFLSWLGVAYFSLFWLGPIRQSIFYPGGSFAFEALLVILLFFALTNQNRKNALLTVFLVLLLSLGREFITYIAVSIAMLHWIVRVKGDIFQNKSLIMSKSVFILRSRHTLSLVLMSIVSLLVFFLIRVLIVSDNQSYSIIEAIVTYGWFHLHIMEFLYPFFYALGPVALIFIALVILKKFRIKFINYIYSSIVNLDIIILFCLFGVIFSMLGGTDSDRFILWFFPFFSIFAFKGVSMLIINRDRNILAVLYILVFSAIFSSRFYVPATPNLFFPGDKYNSQASIKTDYNPSLYYGAPFMEKFRVPLKKVPLKESYTYQNTESVNWENIKSLPEIPEFILRNTPGNLKHWYKGHYRYEINNIPFPLGFSHNQYELYVAHPFYGGIKVKIMLPQKALRVDY